MSRITITWSVGLACNISCEYCIVNEYKTNNKLTPLDLEAAKKFIIGFNKPMHIHFTGGEPLMDINVIDFISWLTNNGHLVSINTNLTINIDKFIERVNMRNIQTLMVSFHIDELLRLNLMDIWISNYKKISKIHKPVADVVAYPKYSDEDVKNHIKLYRKLHNISYKYVPFIGKYNDVKYPFSYTDEELRRFNLEKDKNAQKLAPSSTRYCNAGKTYFVCNENNILRCFSGKWGEFGTIYDFNYDVVECGGVTKCEFSFCPCPEFANVIYK